MENQLVKNSLFVLMAALVACSSDDNSTNSENDTSSQKTIVILYDNDVHCEVSGYSAIAGLRDAIAKSDTAYTALVSSGDYLQGASFGIVSKGEYVVKLLNSSGYDVVGLGNHEFDYKTPRLIELAKEMDATIVSSNLTDSQGKLLFEPYAIKQFGNKKIAFVGVLTPYTMAAEAYSFYDGDWKLIYNLHPDDVIEYVQKAVDDAREEGADYVILLSHVGEIEEVEGMLTSQELVSKTSGIDVVLDAHSHSAIEENWLLNADGDSVLISQTGTKFENIGKLEISPDGKFVTHLIPMDGVTTRSSRVEATYDSILAVSNDVLNEVIASTDFALNINDEDGNRAIRNQETNLGDFIADALRYSAGAQIGMVNGGGVRAKVDAGEITYKNVIDALPYENKLCLLEATGQQIVDALEVSSASVPEEFGGFLQVSGLKFEIDTSVENTFTMNEDDFSLKVDGDRRAKNVMVENEDGSYSEIDLKKKYTVGLSKYLARESGENKTLNKATIKKEFSTTEGDAVIEFLTNKLDGEVPKKYEKTQGRIVIH